MIVRLTSAISQPGKNQIQHDIWKSHLLGGISIYFAICEIQRRKHITVIITDIITCTRPFFPAVFSKIIQDACCGNFATASKMKEIYHAHILSSPIYTKELEYSSCRFADIAKNERASHVTRITQANGMQGLSQANQLVDIRAWTENLQERVYAHDLQILCLISSVETTWYTERAKPKLKAWQCINGCKLSSILGSKQTLECRRMNKGYKVIMFQCDKYAQKFKDPMSRDEPWRIHQEDASWSSWIRIR